jgi:hypothetical protein
VTANDEVDRPTLGVSTNEDALSQSSTSSRAHRRRDPRSLQPIVRGQVRSAHTTTGNATSSTAAPKSQMLCNSGPAVPKSRDIVGISIKPQIIALMASASGTPRRPYTRLITQANGREINAIATACASANHISAEVAVFENNPSHHLGVACAAATPTTNVNASR